MSEEITSVPLHRRKYLSPIYLHCSLGRTPNSNPYSEYRSLISTMNYSYNIRAHALYSGIISAFLETNDNNTNNSVNNSIYNDETLHPNNLASNERIHEFNNPFPRATHIPTDSNALAINSLKFLTTKPPLTRSHAVLPVFIIEEDDENPYYDDTIMKYMFRPYNPNFENLTYPQYFERYSITPSPLAPTQHFLSNLQTQSTITHYSRITRLNNQFIQIKVIT
ncbi:12473_t:CDS:2 [Gigaspora rosea]|nr:12473_t:CDS:2 [Gigaspora rosea]